MLFRLFLSIASVINYFLYFHQKILTSREIQGLETVCSYKKKLFETEFMFGAAGLLTLL